MNTNRHQYKAAGRVDDNKNGERERERREEKEKEREFKGSRVKIVLK